MDERLDLNPSVLPSSLRVAQRTKIVCACAVIAVCLSVLCGWGIGAKLLMSVLPGMISMKVNTAIDLIALSICILTLERPALGPRAVFWLALSLAATIAGLTICEYVLNINLRLDTAIFADPWSARFPGRMAPGTATCFLLMSVALALVECCRYMRTAQILLLLTATAPLVALGGYLYQAPGMLTAAPYPVIALHTTICLMLLCLGGLYGTGNVGLMRLAMAHSLTGRLFRRLFPSAIGVPLVAGFLVLCGEREGLYTSNFGSALVVGCCALFFAIAVWWTASLLSGAEQALQHSKRVAETALAGAEEASRSKDLFISVVSHELRTPLNPILVLASLLQRRTDLPDDVQDDIATIRRNVELEARIVDDLLSLTRLQRGKIQLHQEIVDLHELIRQIVDEVKPEAADRSVRLDTRFSDGRAVIWADAARMRQVLYNLIGNALKFSQRGGVVVVETLVIADGRIALSVIDHGIGIAAEQLSKLFTPFEQGEKTRHRQFGGLGLGLFIAKGIAELHGGTIDVRSAGAGTGATFTLHLKLIPLELVTADTGHSPVADRAAVPVAAVSAPESPVPVPAEPCRILLVEDDPDTRRTMSKLLKSFGYEVTAAASVAEASPHIEAGAFELLLSDIGLPDGSGLDVVRTAKQKRPTRAIAISGFGQAEDIRASKDAGFLEHLVKPVNFDILKATIARTAEQRVA